MANDQSELEILCLVRTTWIGWLHTRWPGVPFRFVHTPIPLEWGLLRCTILAVLLALTLRRVQIMKHRIISYLVLWYQNISGLEELKSWILFLEIVSRDFPSTTINYTSFQDLGIILCSLIILVKTLIGNLPCLKMF